MRRIEEFKIGDKAEFKVDVTLESHQQFAGFSGDKSPVHTDDSFAKKAGFKTRIGYAFQATAYFSRLYGEYLPGGSSICLSQSVKFIKPFYIGDKLTIRGTITHISPAVRVLTIKNEVLNQKAEVCMTGEALVKIVI